MFSTPIFRVLIIASLIILTLVACGIPTDKEVGRAFKKENPEYEIVNVAVGEGDSSAAYFLIKYKKPGDNAIHEDVWQYLKDRSGKWTLNHKETLLGSAQRIAASHIEANVPKSKDFRTFLIRDLEEFFIERTKKAVRIEYDMLREGPTQSGVAYPKYYLWVKVLDDISLIDEGAVRVAAIEQQRFDVIHFLSRTEINRDPQGVKRIFPQALYSKIMERSTR